jgi:hypothetical protein
MASKIISLLDTDFLELQAEKNSQVQSKKQQQVMKN